MIYTVTFNPAIDYVVGVKELKAGMTNRTEYERIMPGGKGLNVSMVLRNLGVESVALGFVAGFTGEEIRRSFEALGGRSDFIKLKSGNSRINIKIKSETETEINAAGPIIDSTALQLFMEKIKALQEGDILILAGSIPGNLPKSLYADITKEVSRKGVLVAVDATGELLTNTLVYKPFLIKPNNHELGEIFGAELKTVEEITECAKKLQSMGARNVLVSMAGDGAVLAAENGEVLRCEAPKGKVINSVGAGDSMVAGFIAGYCENGDIRKAFAMGVASGSATAFSENLATKPEIEKLYKEIKI